MNQIKLVFRDIEFIESINQICPDYFALKKNLIYINTRILRFNILSIILPIKNTYI